MKKAFRKENLPLTLAAILAGVALIAYVVFVFAFPQGNSRTLRFNIAFAAPIAIVNFLIVKAFIDVNENVMKALLGFLLSGLVMLSMHYAFSNTNWTEWFFIVKATIFGIAVLFTLNQFLLSNDHCSRPAILFINQALMSTLTILSIVATIIDTVQCKDNPGIFVSFLLFVLCTMFLILVIEMKVNHCKVQREAKGYVFVKSATNDAMLEEKDMFINNKLFYFLPWIILIGLAFAVIFNAIFDKAITRGYSLRYLFFLVKAIGLFVAVYTYKSHNLNVRKIMVGFLLGVLLFENIFEITFIDYSALTAKSYLTLALLPLTLLFLVWHLLLTKTHASNAAILEAMKVTSVVYTVALIGLMVGWQVYYIVAGQNNWYFFLLKPLFWIMGTLPVVGGVLAIDTRINGFKMRRERLGRKGED